QAEDGIRDRNVTGVQTCALPILREYEIPFEYQKKERLVYCDLIEHSILHVLIAKETSSEFGYLGLDFYLLPDIESWYLDKTIPEIGRASCRERVDITVSRWSIEK